MKCKVYNAKLINGKLDKTNCIVISPDNGGWRINVYDNDSEIIKTAWAMTGIVAMEKALLLHDFYRNHSVILTHEYNADGVLYESNKLIRTGYLID